MKNGLAYLRAGINYGYGTNGKQRVQLLSVDEMEKLLSYQRATIESNIKNIDQNFNPLCLGVIILSERTFQSGRRKGERRGKYKIVDGGHRVEVVRIKKAVASIKAARDKGLHDGMMLCIVLTDMTEEEEAEVYVYYNTNRKVSGNERFKARRLYATVEEACEDAIEEAGFTIDFRTAGNVDRDNTASNALRQADKLLKAFTRFGAEVFSTALQLLVDVWSVKGIVDFDFCKGDLVYALCLILKMTVTYRRSGKTLTYEQLVYWLNRTDIKPLLDDLNKHGSGSGGSRPSILSNWIADQIESDWIKIEGRPKVKGVQEGIFTGVIKLGKAA
jgi:hypothetical protein